MWVKVKDFNNHNSRPFQLQWHLTALCQFACAHCYLTESSTYRNELDNELDFKTCVKVVDDYYASFKNLASSLKITFTGGDPLLFSQFYDLVAYARDKDILVKVLGNPIDENTAKLLAKAGVSAYQVSIDGMEKTHDSLRGKFGAFRQAVATIDALNSVGIRSEVMFTLSTVNADELLDVIQLAAKKQADIVKFARLVSIGNANQLQIEMFSPQEYRSLLLSVYYEYRYLRKQGYSIVLGHKDPLWNLLYYELGLLRPPFQNCNIRGCCSIGSNFLTVLADGTVQSCRRLPITVGKVPEQSLKDIYRFSPILNEMRELKNMHKCYKCELRQVCRGYPCVTYGVMGDYHAPDPQCWKTFPND